MKKILTFLFLATVLAACSSKQTEKRPEPFDPVHKQIADEYEQAYGRYVYVVAPYDLDHRCLHTDDHCRYCKRAIHELHCGVKRIDIDSLTENNLTYCCHECVDDSIYQVLSKLAR